jgi:hypothetical protein
LAPHLKADVAQSNAVSPDPSTITLPYNCGSCDLHAHIPETQKQSTAYVEMFKMGEFSVNVQLSKLGKNKCSSGNVIFLQY